MDNLFIKPRRPYNPITDPIKKEKVRLRNLKYSVEYPDKKRESHKRWLEKNEEYYNQQYFDHFGVLPPEKSMYVSNLEQTWYNFINFEFSDLMSFKKVRPNWLRNPVTGCNLELDMYCEEYNLAIEINGDQHYRYTSKFHKDYDDFLYQKYKDEFKAKRCRNLGIFLIVVSKRSKPSRVIKVIKKYIKNQVYFV